MTSIAMRNNPLFLRNSFYNVGKWDIPLVKKQNIEISDIRLVAYSDTRANDTERNTKAGVHFYVDDFRFSEIYEHPDKSINKLSQYAFLLTPDFSLYADMPLWKQIDSVAKNRWVGAFWQSKGLKVIPTVAWSTPRSFEFCFDGVEKSVDKSGKPVLHYHTYDPSFSKSKVGDGGRSTAKKLTKSMRKHFRKYFKGVM